MKHLLASVKWTKYEMWLRCAGQIRVLNLLFPLEHMAAAHDPLPSLWHTKNEIFQIRKLDEWIPAWLIMRLIGFNLIKTFINNWLN